MNISFNDKIEVRDSFGDKLRPKGRVKIFEKLDNDELKPLIDTNNLVVYKGREWLIQKAFNQELLGWTTSPTQSYISWFGLGMGGTGANLLIPLSPTAQDSDLNQPVIINSTDPLLADSGKLHPFDQIVFEQDTSNSNKYLIARITTTITKEDANGSDGTTYYDLNEAGLYISNSNDASLFDIDTKSLFARVTFSTIRKVSSRNIVFVWYIYL